MFDWLPWLATDTAANVGTFIGGVAAVLAAGIGIWAIFGARVEGRERSRPMVIAELRDVPYTTGSAALVVRNNGPTVARDLVVTFDPPIGDPPDPKRSVAPYLKDRYSRPIPTLAPGQELDNIWYISKHDVDGKPYNDEPMPDHCDVTLQYKGPSGTRKTYSETFTLSMKVLQNRTFSTSSRSPEEQGKKITKSLARIADSLSQPKAASTNRHLSQSEIDRLLGRRTEGDGED